jgi:molybdopterin-guanine dinucleotide biosynthesis protein A
MNIGSDISGFVLAGGKSSRMGFDKAFLMIGNKTLLQNMIDVIKPFCRSVAISGQNPGFDEYNLAIVPDLFLECGPISGLYSVLDYTSTDWNLIVSVDIPFLDDELITYLIGNIGDCDGVIPMHKNGVEPLAGLYHRRILPVIRTQIGQGNLKLSRLLSQINTHFIDCNHIVEKNPKLFHNINSMEDYRNI